METLKELVARVLDVEKEKINDTSSPENISSWDSFNGLMLAAELEKNFNVKFTTTEVVSVTCVKDIKTILKKHGVKGGIDN